MRLLGLCPLAALLTGLPAVALADVVTDWNERALASVAADKQRPPDAARTMAIVHVAMFDAVNCIDGRYAPYRVKQPGPAGSSREAAAVSAAHATLIKLFPDQRAALDAAYTASVAQIADGDARRAGIAVGERVAAEIVALRASDGAGAATAYRPYTASGTYVPTPLPVSSQWGGVTRTPEQPDSARFWAVAGPASWDPLVRRLAAQPGRRLVDNARLFALVEMAASDAFIAVFDAKYAFGFWRPITAIRNGDIDGNDATVRMADWEPLIDTPLHPEYPCAHCITSSAIGVVLESEFGGRPIPVVSMTSPSAPGVIRRWSSIRDYVDEVSAARIYGGIHYRTSARVGQEMGRRIGALVVARQLKPRP
jgi:hypothetical protein